MSKVSFRGNEIPEIEKKAQFNRADSTTVINKIKNSAKSSNEIPTIEAVHFDGRISDVKLTTGDIVPVETAIALAESNLLDGYSTGGTMNGGRTLRSKPTGSHGNPPKGIYELPRF